jgi:putative PEP-CTERM system TPR-repeat lipoprotein
MMHAMMSALTRQGILGRAGFRTMAAAMACGLLALGACDPRGGSIDSMVKRAQDHRAAGSIRASIIELKNALQKDTQNANVRMLLGEAFVDIGDSNSADIELRRAQELGAPPARTAQLLAEAKLLQGRFDQVLRDNPVNEADPAEAKSAVLALRGRAHLGLGQRVQAEQAFKAALDLDPKSTEALVPLSRLAYATNNATAGTDYMARAVAAAPKDLKVLALQGDMAFSAKDFNGAEGFFREVLKLRKDDVAAFNAQLGIARAQVASGNLKDATARLTSMLKVSPNDPATNYLRALAAYQSKDYQTAKTHSENALRIARTHRPSMFIAGAANYGLGQFEQAFRHLSAYVHDVPSNLEARKLLAATQMKMGQADKAVGTLQAATKQPGGEDAQLLAMIGAASAQAGDVRGASRYMERAVAQDPNNPALRARLGATQVALGNVAEGVDELEKAAEQDPAGAADITLIAVHLRAKEWDKALEAALRLQQKQPASASGYIMAGLAEAGRSNFGAAKTWFEKAREIKPDDRAPVKHLAALAIQQNNFDEGRRLYRESLTRAPGDVEFLLLSAQLEERAGRRDEMQRFAEEAVKHNPDNKFAKLSLARVYLLSNEPRKVLDLLQPSIQAGVAEPGYLESAGRAQLALGMNDQAIVTFRELVNVQREAAQAHHYLANAYEAAGLLDRALASADEALRLSNHAAPYKFQHARLLARTGKLDQATKAVAELKQAHGDDPMIMDLDGSLALATKRPNDAVNAYQKLFVAQNTNINLLKLVQAKQQAGRGAEAVGDLEAWLVKYPQDALARVSLGDQYVALKQYDKAVPVYQEVVRAMPDNVQALNNLAWAMAQSGRPNEALPHARKAAALAPDSAAVLDTLGTTLVRAGQPAEAVAPLRRAVEKAPNIPPIEFHLAEALAKQGQRDEARKLLRRALSAKEPFSERADAEKLLQELGG